MYELHAAPQDHYKSGVRKTQAQVPFWPCNALQNALSAPKPSRATKNLTFAFFLPLPNIVDMIASFGLPKRWDCGQYRPGLGLLVLLIWLEKNETASRWPRFRKSVTASFEAGAGSSKNMTHHVSLESSTNAKEATATPSRQKIRRFFSRDQWRSGRHRRPPRTDRGRGRRRGAEIMVGRPPAREPPPARPAVGGVKRI